MRIDTNKTNVLNVARRRSVDRSSNDSADGVIEHDVTRRFDDDERASAILAKTIQWSYLNTNIKFRSPHCSFIGYTDIKRRSTRGRIDDKTAVARVDHTCPI